MCSQENMNLKNTTKKPLNQNKMEKLLYRILKKDMIKKLSEKHGTQFVDDVMATFGMPTDTTNDYLKKLKQQ